MGTTSTPARQSHPNPSRHNLPPSLTSFVGRERERLDIRRLLATSRLLTLTGEGGVGKTRLALEVARTAAGAWPDGVWLVELAPLTESSLIPRVIASALGVGEQPDRSLLATLVDYLQDQSLLVILDNCEHLVADCAKFAERLLLACPGLQILATSREALGTAGEVLWRVPGLTVPGSDAEPIDRRDPAAVLARSEAVRLFCERAIATLPAFTLTERNAPLVGEICRQLGGMPLAIELAAARVGVLSVNQIVARLENQLGLLASGRRTALPRHRTPRALVDWSHDLLPSGERILLRRLSVFAGGWTLDAAEAVCAGDGVAREEILDLLAQLVAKSLVQVDNQDTDGRYRFLETIRQYAAERLREAGEEPVLRRRHRDWAVALAEEAEPYLNGPDQLRWVDHLNCELDNIRAALDWSIRAAGCAETGTDDAGLRIAAALLWFWYHDRFGEGRQWLERALASAEATASPARARALVAAGHLAYYQGDLVRSDRMLGEGLRLHRELGDRRGTAFALASLGYAAQFRGEFDRATSLLEESLELARATGDAWAVGRALQNLGVIAYARGDRDRARPLLEESLATWRHVAGSPALIMSRYNLGRVAHAQGDHAHAAEQLGESLALARAMKNRWWIATVLHSLGRAMLALGDTERAAALHRESLALRIEGGDQRSIAEALEGQAGVAVARGEAARAARLLGAAEALRAAIGSPVPPADRADHEADRQTVRSMLDEESFSTAWAEGRAMGRREAAEYALEAGQSSSPTAAVPKQSPDPWSTMGGSALSPREREVALLVARGRKNREIAETLVIGGRTVETHVTNVLAKLGLTSRSQIAAWVVERGVLTDDDDEPSGARSAQSTSRRR
jgi:predicted ATPase/DNA-binding CsgD family transcriptional regulator